MSEMSHLWAAALQQFIAAKHIKTQVGTMLCMWSVLFVLHCVLLQRRCWRLFAVTCASLWCELC